MISIEIAHGEPAGIDVPTYGETHEIEGSLDHLIVPKFMLLDDLTQAILEQSMKSPIEQNEYNPLLVEEFKDTLSDTANILRHAGRITVSSLTEKKLPVITNNRGFDCIPMGEGSTPKDKFVGVFSNVDAHGIKLSKTGIIRTSHTKFNPVTAFRGVADQTVFRQVFTATSEK